MFLNRLLNITKVADFLQRQFSYIIKLLVDIKQAVCPRSPCWLLASLIEGNRLILFVVLNYWPDEAQLSIFPQQVS